MNMRRLLLFSPALLVGLAISIAMARPSPSLQDESDPAVSEVDQATEPEEVEAPEEIVTEAPVGEVTFPHYMHVEALEIACNECHHETNAKPLYNPHPQYFSTVWGECTACHKEDASDGLIAGKCSSCHPDTPRNTSDAALSAKVVIHRQCWNCHDVGTGVDASKECSYCHSGDRAGFAPIPR